MRTEEDDYSDEYQKLFKALQNERRLRNLEMARRVAWWKQSDLFKDDEHRQAEWKKYDELEIPKGSD